MNTSFLRLSAAIVCSMAIVSCGSKKQTNNQANAPVPVNLYEVHPQSAYYYDEYPATVTALSQVDLHAEVEGYITGIFFKEGDHVRKGQKLYEIDRSKYMASYDQAQANVKVAQANQAQAQAKARSLAEALHEAPASWQSKKIPIAFSFGAFELSSSDSADLAIARADEAMYAHKRATR